jgi:hypothetical protein
MVDPLRVACGAAVAGADVAAVDGEPWVGLLEVAVGDKAEVGRLQAAKLMSNTSEMKIFIFPSFQVDNPGLLSRFIIGDSREK